MGERNCNEGVSLDMSIKDLPTQDLLLELIRRAGHNALDGKQVYRDLQANRSLWRSCFIWMGLTAKLREMCDSEKGYKPDSLVGTFATLVPLRDLDQESKGLHVDELFIITAGQDDDKLLEIAKSWEPDECDWLPADLAQMMIGRITFGEGCRTTSNVLRVWWD